MLNARVAPVVKHLFSKTCIALHSFQTVCSEHKKGGNCYKKKVLVIGPDVIGKY